MVNQSQSSVSVENKKNSRFASAVKEAVRRVKTKLPVRSGFYWFRGVDRSDSAWEILRIDGLSDGRLRVFDTFCGDSFERFLADWPAGEWRAVVRPVVRSAS